MEAKAEPMKPLPAPPVPVLPHVVAVRRQLCQRGSAAAARTPKPAIKTNVFAGYVSRPTIKAPVKQVQTRRFG